MFKEDHLSFRQRKYMKIRKQLEQIIKQQYQEKGMEDPTETDIV